jgi:hypothetical protein
MFIFDLVNKALVVLNALCLKDSTAKTEKTPAIII